MTHKSCFSAGWGDNKSEKRLKEAKIKIISSKKCRVNFRNYFQPKKQLCAISHSKAKTRKGTPCHGDSGGPLVCQHRSRLLVHNFISHCNHDSYLGLDESYLGLDES